MNGAEKITFECADYYCRCKCLGQAEDMIADLRQAAMDVIEQERPGHEHYEDHADCALCRLFLVMDVEGRDE